MKVIKKSSSPELRKCKNMQKKKKEKTKQMLRERVRLVVVNVNQEDELVHDDNSACSDMGTR